MITNTKSGLVLLLLFVFLVNLGETWLETSLRTGSPISAADYRGAYAVQQFEPAFINFEFHDQTAKWAMYAYSISYFALLPILGLGVLVALARREEFAPFRVLCLAVTADYFVSLPWFLLFPVPERWAYPESNAILLSDQWSSSSDQLDPADQRGQQLVPEHHVSLTVVVIAGVLAVSRPPSHHGDGAGMMVILATFVLGIHWLADIMAGVAVGLLSVADCLAMHRYVRAPGARAGVGGGDRPQESRVRCAGSRKPGCISSCELYSR
jgi:hypothetical protein